MSYRGILSVLLIAFVAAAQLPAGAGEESSAGEERMDPILSLGGLTTEEYSEGIGDLVLPLYFSGQGLWFLNPRLSFTDRDAEEYNLGLGYRHLLADGRMIGGLNVFYDRRETALNASFNQVGAGAEMLSHWIDARANVYLPLNREERVNEFSTVEEWRSRGSRSSTVLVWADPYATGNEVLQDYETRRVSETWTTTTTTTRHFHEYEIAMRGWDAEIGVRLPIAPVEEYLRLKTFAGYYKYYGRRGLSDVDGFRGRLELHLKPAFVVGGVYTPDDALTGGTYSIGAYVSLPFDLARIANGRNPFAGAAERWEASRRMDDLQHRLTDRIERDPQIRTRLAEPQEQASLRTTASRTDRRERSEKLGSETVELLTDVTFVAGDRGDDANPGTFEEPKLTIQGGVGIAESPVWVFNAATAYEESITVPANVQLYGEGTTVQGFGGKTWGGGTHPVVIGQAVGPVVTLQGDRTAVSGFELRHSGAGAPGSVKVSQTIQATAYEYDITHAGVFGMDVSDVQIHDNRMTDGSLGHGIVLLNDGSLAGGNMNLVATLLNNDIQNASIGALVVSAIGGSGRFDVKVSGNYSASGEMSGIHLRSEGHDTAMAELFDITANDNTWNGITAWVGAVDDAILLVRNTVTDRNEHGLDGGAKATGAGGFSHVSMENIQANDNVDWGLYYAYALSTHAEGGDAMVVLENITANHNGDGMEIRAEAYGEDARAGVIATGLEASHNSGDGIYELEAKSEDGSAFIYLSNVTANHNLEDGIQLIEAQGVEGDAVVWMDSIQANDNMGNGLYRLWAHTHGELGDARMMLGRAEALRNGNDSGIAYVYSEAYGADGHALLLLNDVTVNDNDEYGIYELKAYSEFGSASILLNEVEASGNEEPGISYIRVDARGASSRANVTLADVTANNNNNDGIMSVDAQAPNGSADIFMTDVSARFNTGFGMRDVRVIAGGPDPDGDAELWFTDSDLRNNASGPWLSRFLDATGGGSTTEIIDNVLE